MRLKETLSMGLDYGFDLLNVAVRLRFFSGGSGKPGSILRKAPAGSESRMRFFCRHVVCSDALRNVGCVAVLYTSCLDLDRKLPGVHQREEQLHHLSLELADHAPCGIASARPSRHAKAQHTTNAQHDQTAACWL